MIERDRQIYYTIPDMAKMFNVHVRTIRRIIKDGKIEAFRVGAQWRVSSFALDEYIARNTNNKNGDR